MGRLQLDFSMIDFDRRRVLVDPREEVTELIRRAELVINNACLLEGPIVTHIATTEEGVKG